jgi:rhodanese-related sulfurtransferase
MDAEITPEEVEALLESDDRPRVIDIRSPGEFARGHIPGSENVPFGELPDRIEEFAGADRIVTVCPHGKASVQAARLVGSYEGTKDARVESMAGGLEAWGGPLEANEADGETPDSPF